MNEWKETEQEKAASEIVEALGARTFVGVLGLWEDNGR